MTKQTGHDLLPHTARKAPRMGMLKYRLLALLSVLGPGFITANVDNDPGGILTYSQAGAKYGYALLWTLVPTTIALIVVQEMASRMAVATGKELRHSLTENCSSVGRSSRDIPITRAPSFLNSGAASLKA
jgi:hypothetical protein